MEPEQLIGQWRLDKSITDEFAGQEGWFRGRATFAPAGAGRLHYAERGVVRMGEGPELNAAQNYAWSLAGPVVSVFFSDGRAFHDFDPAAVPCTAEHHCDPDHYAVTYDFARFPHWTAEWSVRGPRKRYAMRLRYRRA